MARFAGMEGPVTPLLEPPPGSAEHNGYVPTYYAHTLRGV